MHHTRNLNNLPIPISDQLLKLAWRLKETGLDWSPEVGQFVWDFNRVIKSPSPFPLRVYFILNIKRFLNIFGSTDKMKSNLVWIPTSYQLRTYAERKRLTLEYEPQSDPEEDLIALYSSMIQAIRTSSGAAKDNQNDDS